MGQGYADITKLREISAKHQKNSTRLQTRAARVHTRIEKLRHRAALLREKAQKTLGEIPELEQEMQARERTVKAAQERAGGTMLSPDITNEHLRIRKVQQKIVDRNHKARTLEHKAAQATQKAAELKVRADRFLEQAKLEEQEALTYRDRADRLQRATESDLARNLPAPGPGEPPPAGPQ